MSNSGTNESTTRDETTKVYVKIMFYQINKKFQIIKADIWVTVIH